MTSRATSILLNIAHAIDHMFLLVFAAAIGSIASDFGIARWEDLMPYGVGAFALFGLGALPSGRLGDLWGRRRMMLVFFYGMGAAALLTALTQNAWQLAAALTLLGAFASIYHPVGIPMLVRHARRPGLTIGFNGLAGNLGVALAAVVTGFLVKYFGWRSAFAVPALATIACGILFARVTPHETEPPAQRARTHVEVSGHILARVFLVLTIASSTATLLFNFTTNGNGELLRERFVGIVALQAPLFLLAAQAHGWALYALMMAFMIVVFGAIPFTDAMIVRYVDDRMRSRVSGMRLTVALGVSSLAVWLLGPLVKAGGFRALFLVMAGTALCTLVAILFLPRSAHRDGSRAAIPDAPPQSPRAAD